MVELLSPLSALALIIVIVIATILVMWEEYDDGVIGKIALIALVIAAFVSLERICSFSMDTGIQCYGTVQEEALLHVALAGWLLRHFYRFLCYQFDGKYAWLRKPKCE